MSKNTIKNEADQKKDGILWKDRRRRLGLPLSFTRYYLRENRLFLSTGFFNTHENEMLLYRILDFSLKRTLGDKLFGVGTVTLYTADESNKTLELKKIKNSVEVRDMISKLVEEERTKLRIRGREMYGIADGDVSGSDGDLF
ncbi:MAG: PH domain-containing protein [Vallitaleaceae bacterium]|jgi:hypothetical protein|nr:PH domain-containing protein [Vallitaleaceae bacterium]